MRYAIVLVALLACGKKKETPAQGSGTAVAVGDASVPGDAKLDPKEAAAQYDTACIGGDAEACRNLGVLYSEGIGVAADPKRATALFAQACNKGSFAGCNHTALALAEGIGVAQDVPKSTELFTKSCEGGYALACRNLGLMLRDGRGVEKDLAKAEVLLEKACKGKAPFACTNAGDVHKAIALLANVKDAAVRDARWKKMIDLYKQGCEDGDPASCRSIGIAYLEGTGLPKTPNAAAVWLTRACDKDEPIACRVLGAMLFDGVGVKKDPAKGRELMKRACDRKDTDACTLITKMDAGSASTEAPPVDAGVQRNAPM
ncbi:MAG: sel1 repeat family protein [Myxococcota bacterium]|nr:sel1 repeat family protein [Deltaproteobacteria bacterium]MDQ3334386.1 sel1 repeat family protein [Myxococcota bacterium]